MTGFLAFLILLFPLMGLFFRHRVLVIAIVVPLTWTGLALWSWINATGVLISQANNGAYHDTYYIVSYANAALSIGLTAGLPFVVAAVLTWLNAVYLPRLLSSALLLAHAGLCVSNAPQALDFWRGMPLRYIDYPLAFARWNQLSYLGALLTFCATLLFLILTAYCLIRRIRTA